MRSILLLLIACDAPEATDLPPNPTPKCDGIKQAEEDSTDAPFDADGDGFFDASNPDCVAAWPPNNLDCDDNNPDINPSKLEIPCNGIDDDCNDASAENRDADGDGVGQCEDCNDGTPLISPNLQETCYDHVDNDCDGIVDNDCGDDNSGEWVLHTPIVDACSLAGIPLIDIHITNLSVIWNPPHISINTLNSLQPPSMEGVAATDGSFEAHAVLGTFAQGDCVESYTFQGTFVDDTLTGRFVYDFQTLLTCGGCNLNNDVQFTATRE